MNSEEYWVKRNEKVFLAGEKDALQVATDLQKNYNQAIRNIENEINIFYGKYATTAQLDMNEVKKLLNKSELKSFKEYLDDMIAYSKKAGMTKQYINDLKLLRIKLRVSRLEELKTKMNFEIEKLSHEVDNKVGNMIGKTYEKAYYKTIYNIQKFTALDFSFTELNLKAIEKAISTKYMAENYSQVLWRNKESLKLILNQQIPQGIILGYNPKKVASIASKKLDTNYKSTVRLVRTEYNLILNDAVAKGYKEAGIEKYQLLATLDSRTSDICISMDGQIFELAKSEVGVNYPPFHPNCRTTTIPYFEPDEFDEAGQRIARDEQGRNYYVPGSLTYKEWYEHLQPGPDGTLRYKN